jgi:predicted transcriptional regulator
VSKITDLYSRGRKALADGDAASWAAAEAMAELYKLGESQQAIAKGLGCHNSTVSRYLAVFRSAGGGMERPPFSEAMAAVRTDNETRVNLPKAPERRAELVAELLKDKAVADAPVVQAIQQAATTRRLRAETAAANRRDGVPTRTETEQDDRRTSTLANDMFWHRLESDIGIATTRLNEAARQVEQTGLPRSASGGLVRKTRALVRAAERFEQAATEAGIGQAMATPNGKT